MNRYLKLAALVAIELLGCQHPTAPITPHATVSEADLRAGLDRYVCAAWLEELQLYEPRFGDPRCAPPLEESSSRPLDEAVRLAIDDCVGLDMLAAPAYEAAYAHLEARDRPTAATADEIVRDAYWSDPHLGPAALARALEHLRVHGSSCVDCELATPVEARVTNWSSFRPHVAAHVWPSQADNAPVELHVCSAANGVSELGLTDTRLLEAGFLAAVALASAPSTQTIIEALVAHADASLPALERSVAEFIDSDLAREVICGELDRLAWYTRLHLGECHP